MSKNVKESIEVLEKNIKEIGEDKKYVALLPCLDDAKKIMEGALKKAEKIEDPSYYRWFVHPTTELQYQSPDRFDSYDFINRIVRSFVPEEVFTTEDFEKRALTDDDIEILKRKAWCDNYLNIIRSRFYYLNIKGFLDMRKIPTEKKDRRQYRINRKGLDMLQKQAMKEEGMRVV